MLQNSKTENKSENRTFVENLADRGLADTIVCATTTAVKHGSQVSHQLYSMYCQRFHSK